MYLKAIRDTPRLVLTCAHIHRGKQQAQSRLLTNDLLKGTTIFLDFTVRHVKEKLLTCDLTRVKSHPLQIFIFLFSFQPASVHVSSLNWWI